MLTPYPNQNYNTFCIITDADEIITNLVPNSETWLALTEAKKEIYLRQATLLIKTKITLPTTLEDNLKTATAYLANYSIDKDMTNSDGKEGNVKVKEIVGVVSTTYFNSSKDSDSFPSLVDMLLKDYQYTSGNSFVFERA